MTKPRDVTIVLISSAGTGWDETGRLVGQATVTATDAALTLLHDRLRDAAGTLELRLDLVLAGPEDSTKASAALVAEAFGGKTRVLDAMANVDLGLWEGALRDELEGRCPSIYKAWRDQPASVRPPEGESLADAAERAADTIRRAIEKCRAEHPRVAVVVRSMLAAALAARWGEEPWSAYWTLAGQTGEIRVIERSLVSLTPDPASVPA
ncbi:MAG: histidine phosphatase family protein [Planctomycetota bacterium]|nr:MAG: histidine phosphatase family protein [Planctomycetota bacterium]